MIDVLGFLGALFLGLCALPEVFSSVRKGYCGSSWGLLLIWWLGEIMTFSYVFITNPDIYLLCNYGLNCILILVLFYYKNKPMRPERIKELHNFLALKD